MPMKSLKKGLSVLLSLVLCGSMVIPAFAAVTFADLDNAINYDSDNGIASTGTRVGDRYVYGVVVNESENKYEIEAWDDTDSGDRNVQVNTDITYDPDIDGEYGTTIYVGGGKDVNLDLGKNTITGTKDASVIYISDGDPDDSSSPAPDVTITGGTITNVPQKGPDGNADGGTDSTSKNSVIYVGKNAELTLDDTDVIGGEDTQSGIYAGPGADVTLTGGATVSNSNQDGDDVYLSYGDIGLNGNSGKNASASINTPEGGSWVDNSGNPVTPDEDGIVTSDKALGLTWKPNSGSNNEGGGGTSTEVEITDPDVPLAEGPVSCAEFIHKMWVLDGEPAPLDDRGLPEGVDEGHEFAPAIAWAASADIVPVDGFDAEALLTVALAREYLTSFAAYADMAMPELVTLTGKDDDLVLNSDGVLDEFFGEKDSE